MNEPATDSETETILLVDDDRSFCGALAIALRRRGFVVVVAHDHDEAMAEAEAWSPDRAVVDLRLPGKGGLEIVQGLRKILPSVKILILTGYGSIATAVEAIKIGAVHYLTKPAEVDAILAAFERKEASLDVEAPTSPRPLDEVEWEHLQTVLTDCGGNVSEAARRLGMHRRSLQRKLARGRPDSSGGPA